jgi:pyridoxamine 5'-phosphate oxidase
MTDPRARPFPRSELDDDPLRQFEKWRAEAGSDAVALATATPDGAPSVRMVLLKNADAGGFTFHTNYKSRKGRELESNPRAALLFYWHELGRQVRVEGSIERVGRDESETYFRTRPRGAQLAALASAQSEPVESREVLDARFAELERRHPDEVPLPDAWGGYRLVPETYEFWQHRENRLHDRFRYSREGEGWTIERLSP